MLKISFRNQFKKELKKQQKRGKNPQKLLDIVQKLANEEILPKKYHHHKLTGNFRDRWECHIEPDWLLVYYKGDHEIILERTGSHSDLFK